MGGVWEWETEREIRRKGGSLRGAQLLALNCFKLHLLISFKATVNVTLICAKLMASWVLLNSHFFMTIFVNAKTFQTSGVNQGLVVFLHLFWLSTEKLIWLFFIWLVSLCRCSFPAASNVSCFMHLLTSLLSLKHSIKPWFIRLKPASRFNTPPTTFYWSFIPPWKSESHSRVIETAGDAASAARGEKSAR